MGANMCTSTAYTHYACKPFGCAVHSPERLLGTALPAGGTELPGRLPAAVTDAERIGARGGSAGPGRLLLASERLPGGIGTACGNSGAGNHKVTIM